MIHLFHGRKRILSFPRKWANAIVRWIAGINSPSGTVKIKNTLNPGDGGSLELDVNMEAVTHGVIEKFETRPVTQEERKRLKHHLRGMVDGSSIQMGDGHMSVNGEWVDNRIREFNKPDVTDTGEPATPTQMPSGEQGDTSLDANDTTTWTADGADGLLIYLPCKSESAGTRGRLHWRPFTIRPDGRIFSVGAENSYTKYWANPA